MKARAVVVLVALAAAGCGTEAPPGGTASPPATGTPGGEPRACTEIGCSSGVRFLLSHDLVEQTPYDVEACIEGECYRATLIVAANAVGTTSEDGRSSLSTDADEVRLAIEDGDWSGTYDVSVEVRGPSGAVVAAFEGSTGFERQQPNGPGCPPVCWFADVRV